MSVYGVSFDSREENAAFVAKFAFPFPLLCDTERAMGLAYGACDSAEEVYAKRLTYLVGPDGTIEHAIDTKDPGGQAAAILASLA